MDGLSIDEISDERIKVGLIKAVKDLSNSNNVKLCIEHGSKKGDNLMGEIYRILYNGVDDNFNETVSTLILKIAPRDLIMREKIHSRQSILQEIYMYDEVLSYFHDFQLSKGVNPKENGFNECAKRYFSISDELSESLFLEDLQKRKFEMLNHREKWVNFDHISLMMKALGKLHALSFAIKDQQPKKFTEFTNSIKEQFWSFIESKFNKHFKNMMNRFTSILAEENRLDLLERFKKATGNDLHGTLHKLLSGASAEPYAVICHGDPTINNFMFINNEKGNPIEITLFDWQFARYASPVLDLVVFLFGSTSKELRDQHYEDFLQIYHQSLSDLLIRLASDPEVLFPYKALLNQFRNFGLYTVFVGAFLLPMLCADIDTMPELEPCLKADLNDPKYKNTFHISDESKAAYNKRVTDIFVDLARFNYL